MTALEEIKKTNHPDRIWATVNGVSTRFPDGARRLVGGWSQDADRTGAVEYVLASTLESLQRENEELKSDLSHEASHRRKLQNSLAYWMPGVTEEVEISTNGRCGDDALLLVGSEGPFEDKCWGNEALARAEAAEAEVVRLTHERYDLAYAITGGEDAPGLLDTVPTSQLVEIARDTHRSHSADLERAMAAEAKVECLSKSLLSDETVEVVAEAIWSIRRVEEDRCDMSLEDIGGQESSVWHEAKSALQALASTGGEHHAE